MAQFEVFRLDDDALVIDVQSDFINAYGTRLVVPLVEPDENAMSVSRLIPELIADGSKRLLATPLAAAVPKRSLGKPIESLEEQEYVIKAALDMVISGF